MTIKTAEERLWEQIIEQKKKGELLEVVGVGIGKEEIAVLVEKKTAELEKKIKALDSGGYRVETVVTGKIRSVYGKGGGICNQKIGRCGTVAIPVYRKSDDALMLLSCNHVLCMNTNRTTRSVKGDTIIDRGGKVIATLEAWEPIKVTCWAEGGVQKCDYFVKNYIDAAIAKPLNPAEITGIGEVFSTMVPKVGGIVTFHGSVSGENTGEILYTDLSYGITFEDEVYNLFDCFLIKVQSASGDSGGIITTRDGKTAVGMLLGATNEGYTIGCPINKVLNTLGLTLVTTENMAEKCEAGSVFFSGTVTINGCTIKGIALEANHEPTHRINITLPWGEKKNRVGMTPGSCYFYRTADRAILCKVCLDKVVRYTCYYTVCRTVSVCSQNIRVKDKDTGVGIANATVAARPSVGSIIRCKTDSNGRCSLTNLIAEDRYRLVVEGIPLGYKCQYTADCETTITACEGEKTFRLREEILICEQKIKVIDEGGSLTDASVSVSGATCTHISKGKYKITLSTGDSLKAKAIKSGYTDATYDFTACRSEITLTLRKEVAPPEYCYQYVRVETSDGKSVTYEITWGPGTWATGSTPDTSMLYCEKGKSHTATATASGYKSASNRFTACNRQFTLTLTKEVAPPACGTYTTKSSCEAAGCYWYNNACHEYGPVKCSDYTDALTCAANNCYWWTEGTCHDTEESPPVSAYEECGRVPTRSDSKTYITDWWKCACAVGEKRGICSSSWTSWFNEVYKDIRIDLGVEPHKIGVTSNQDGDYIKIWMGYYPEVYLGRFKWKCPVSAGKFIINVPKGIFGPIGKGVVMVYKVHKLPFIDAYVGLGIPAKDFWCETPPCTFEVAGLEKGGKYAIFPSSSISVLPYVTSKCVYEFTDKVQTIDLPVYIDPLTAVLCDFFDLTPSECAVFLLEFADPIYVANTLSVIRYHEDIVGTPREPETLDYIMLPIVMVGSLLPMVPMGKISQWTGRGLKLAKKSATSKIFLIKHQHKIHHLTAVGDEARILEFKKLFDRDSFDAALKVLDEGVVASEATEAAKALKRTNLRKWIRGIIAKWKADKPKTTIEKLMDDTAEHGGNVFKTQADVVVKHVDDAKGDWTKIRKIWDDTVKTADDVVHVDLHLAGKSDDVQVIHNMMRYTKDDFVKALKAEHAIKPEKFANRFDEGVNFMLRHIGDETGMEVAKYRKAIKGLSDADINNIVKNLDAVGQGNLARIIKTLKVAPEGGMKYFDDAADALKGVKKLSAEERKALGGVLDTGFDDAVKHLDAKWKGVFNKIFDTEDSIKNPQGRRFWNYIRGHGKTKDMLGKYGVSRFRDLPFFAKAAVFMGVFYVVNSAWKTMQDFCFALFMGEETIQWGGFGGIVLNNLLYKFNEKPLQEKKEIIKTFEEFSEKRHTIHDLVTGGSSLFESLCLVFGKIFKGFWEADAVNMWALDTTIEYLKKGINPYTGIGECSIKVRANKDGVDFWYQGSPTKWHGGKAFSWTEIKLIPVRATPEEVTVCAWKAGYSMATHIIKIFPEDVGKTGYNAKEMELFELIPESSVSGTPNPLGYQTPPDTTNLPPPYGNADSREYFGEVIYGSIRCESIPMGAGVYLDVKDSDHYKGKTDITLDHISVGTHKIIQTFPKFNDCVVNVNVVVEPMVYARCRYPTPTCSFIPSTTKPKLNEVITFDASASSPGTGAASLTYDWDWGDNKPHGTRKIETHAYTVKGVYAVKLTVTNEMGGSKVCTTNITVEVATGNIKCYCESAEYCGRNADILVDGKKVDVTKATGYTYIKNLAPGTHTVKYTLLDVMGCSGSVTVTADKDVDFKCQLKSKLPASQTAKVTAIVDGDGIRTNVTDALPVPSGQTHQTVRIVGYDAYECRVYPSDCTTFGKYAYDELKKRIPIGTSITLKIDEWLPLGAHNRVIAGVFVGTKDIVAEMLKSCLVSITEKKYRDRYYWITWADYERIWCDPTEAVASAEHKPQIIDINAGTFKIENRWLTLWLYAVFVDKTGIALGNIGERQVGGGKTSSAITYFAGTYAIKLYARVDKKEDWTLVDTGYVAVAPPTKKTVTFKSVPSGASVKVVKKETARLVRALKRVKSKRVIGI